MARKTINIDSLPVPTVEEVMCRSSVAVGKTVVGHGVGLGAISSHKLQTLYKCITIVQMYSSETESCQKIS